jgi:hypothetical protein
MDLPPALRAYYSASPSRPQEPLEEEYRVHPWNINCLSRSPGSVLRYIKCKELVTGVDLLKPGFEVL